MEIPFQGEFSISMLRRMIVTAFRPTRGRMITISVFAFFFLWGAVLFPLTHGATLADLGPTMQILGPLLLIAAFVFYSAFIWGPKKQLAGNRLLQGRMTGVAREEGIRFDSLYTKSDLPWDVFTKAKIGKSIVLLYHSAVDYQCHPFPREFFANDQDWTNFVDQVRQHVPVADTRGRKEALAWLWLLLLIVATILGLFIYYVLR